MNYKDYIRVVENFPKEGVKFKDITTLLQKPALYHQAIDDMKRMVEHLEIDLIAGPEARGFVVGAPLAYAMGKGFIPIRKSGKLPAECIEASYDLEYGKDKLAMHKDAITPGQRILIADDLLATGGTIVTCRNLIEQLGGEVVGAIFMIELGYLGGRKNLEGMDIYRLMDYA